MLSFARDFRLVASSNEARVHERRGFKSCEMDIEAAPSDRQLSVCVQNVEKCTDSGCGSCWLFAYTCETRETGAGAIQVNPHARSQLLDYGAREVLTFTARSG